MKKLIIATGLLMATSAYAQTEDIRENLSI